VLRAGHRKGARAVSVTTLKFPHFHPRGSGARPDLSFTPELGGSELKRVKEQLYPNDFEWSTKGRCAVKMPPQRVYVELWPEVAPLAVENFVALLLGNRGKGQESGCEMTYVGCHFHRIIKGFVAQGGDFVKNNGSGGECVFPLSSPARRPASRTTRWG